jgi:hypothetical protein
MKITTTLAWGSRFVSPRGCRPPSPVKPGHQNQFTGWERGILRGWSEPRRRNRSVVANPVGMLIQDAGGHVIEIVSSAGRPASLDAAEQWPRRHVARLPPVTGLNLTFYWRSHVHCTEH